MKSKAKDLGKATVLNFLHKGWGFTENTNITPLSGGTESAAWVVEGGGNNNKWIAKVFGLGEKLTKIKDELNFCRFLNEHGIHAPILKPDLNNQELNFIDLEGYKFPVIVMRFEDLRMCTPSTITHDELTKIATETQLKCTKSY